MGTGGADFLFARQSFLGGVARILDLGGTLVEFNQSLTPQQADELALRADFRTVGVDLRHAADGVIAELEYSQLTLAL